MPTVTPDSSRAANAADQAYSKVIWRFMPLLFICYVIAYLDRVNVGFAKLNMLSAGLFLIAGCLVASALLMLVFIPARVVNR